MRTRHLVIGAAKSGVASANFLAARGGSVVLADAKPDPALPYALDDRVVRAFGSQDESLLDSVDEIILSPGVPMTTPLLDAARKRSIPIAGEIELAYRFLKGTVIAITGSNGKSTTTALVGEILRVAGRDPIVAGNIGEPLIASLDLGRERTYVLELSSFQLEAVDRFHANVAVLLNITPDHMDRYESLADYAAAKYRIFRNQTENDVAIINESLQPPATPARVRTFGGTELAHGESRMPRSALRLEGNANVENALAAWLAARAVGVGDDAVREAFGSFAGLPHRMVLVREVDGVRYVNDSKGTNVDATLKSLEGFPPSSVILILGGKDKAGEFERMRDLVQSRARTVLTIGAAADRIAEALNGSAEILPVGNMAGAIAWAREHARRGETVLLSPACASFDQYRNFEHRGQHFEELVRAL